MKDETGMLKGKVALVTGSTSGIGLAIARVLAEKGADVMLNGFGDAAEVEGFRAGIEKDFGVRALYNPADMSDPAACVSLVKDTEARFGAVDILVNNAGIQHVAPIEEFPPEKWDAIIAINLSSSFHTIRTALPGMKKRGWGRIVNIASTHGLVASPFKVPYVAAKHGLIGMTKGVALECGESGVTCNAVCPGWVLTPMVQKQVDARAAKEGISIEQASRDLVSEKQATGRFTMPEQIGAAVAFFCSPGASNITGTHIVSDGGWTAI